MSALVLPAPQLAHVHRLVARLLLRELDEDAVRALGTPATREVLEAAAPGAGAALEDWNPAREARHAEEFARLFLVPGGVSPRAAAWLPGERERLGAGVAREVRALLAWLGRSVDAGPGVGRIAEDHVALLFELSAWALDAEPARGERFVAAAVSPWARPFAEALARDARLPLYRALGEIIARLHRLGPGDPGASESESR